MRFLRTYRENEQTEIFWGLGEGKETLQGVITYKRDDVIRFILVKKPCEQKESNHGIGPILVGNRTLMDE